MMRRNSNLDLKPRYSSPNTQQTSFSPGNWKSYMPSHKVSTHINDSQRSGLASPNHRRREREEKKEEMMKKMRDIKQKIMPILRADHKIKEDEDIGWTNKMEQRILKLETSLDCIDKEMEIAIQKRMIEVENFWRQKFDELIGRYVNLQDPEMNASQNGFENGLAS